MPTRPLMTPSALLRSDRALDRPAESVPAAHPLPLEDSPYRLGAHGPVFVRDGRDNADSLERTYPDALSDEVVRSDFLSRNKNAEIGLWERRDGVNVPWWVPPADAAGFGTMSRYERCMLLWREMTRRARAV